MQEFKFKQGVGSVKLRVKLYDSSITTDPRGLTGLSSGSAGLTISTIHDNEAAPVVYTGAGIEAVVTKGTFGEPAANRIRFSEVDAVNLPGIYEIHIRSDRFTATTPVNLTTSKE